MTMAKPSINTIDISGSVWKELMGIEGRWEGVKMWLGVVKGDWWEAMGDVDALKGDKGASKGITEALMGA